MIVLLIEKGWLVSLGKVGGLIVLVLLCIWCSFFCICSVVMFWWIVVFDDFVSLIILLMVMIGFFWIVDRMM